MASQVQIPFEGVILQEHSAPISCPTPNFAKGSSNYLFRGLSRLSVFPTLALAPAFLRLSMRRHSIRRLPLGFGTRSENSLAASILSCVA